MPEPTLPFVPMPALAAPVILAEYRPPCWLVDRARVQVWLDPRRTRVRAALQMRPAAAAPLRLDAAALEVTGLRWNGTVLDPGRVSFVPGGLELDVAGAGLLEVDTVVDVGADRAANTDCLGLYRSAGCYVTQCAPDGFRRMMCFPDRPDVLTVFTTTLIADKGACPVLLANGNKVAAGDLPGARHFVTWHDPIPKPCYVFALVAGDLEAATGHFVTASGRAVALAIYAMQGQAHKAAYAMGALQRAMRWDETEYGRDYDLDYYNIVAMPDFRLGAMENKGLNIFNARYVLADPRTATDAEYRTIETVIAHEYLHNWTGNRVTVRDWFELPLSEGLTVFRDQEFMTARMGVAKRIADVKRLCACQFPLDAGARRHRVRPERYASAEDFCMATVYLKGAELVRMLRTVLGKDAFRAGMDLFFDRHDGQAVRVEDFLAALSEGAGWNVMAFLRWYDTAGTPRLTVADEYDAAAERYTLTLSQLVPGETEAVLPIPVRMGLLGAEGRALAVRHGPVRGTEFVLLLDAAEKQFVFEEVTERPVPSVLRGFSAPVLCAQPMARLRFLAAHDSDKLVRWQSWQAYATQCFLEAVAARAAGRAFALDEGMCAAFAAFLRDAPEDPGFAAEALALPAETALAERMAVIDVEGVHAVRAAARAMLGETFRCPLRLLYERLTEAGADRVDGAEAGRRALRNAVLGYLGAAGETALVAAQFAGAGIMADRLAALALLNDMAGPAREAAFAAFAETWRGDDLVLDKWFSLQATSCLAEAPRVVAALAAAPDFDWCSPNRVLALIGAFAMANPLHFHAADGAGYRFLAACVLRVDRMDAALAARLVPPLGHWRRHPPERAAAMRAVLAQIAGTEGVSPAVRAMSERCLN